MNSKTFDITKVMEYLINKKIFFSCETEFQFELAWCIKELYPTSKVKFEYNWNGKENEAIDIIVILDNIWYPIELKYPTKKCKVEFEGFTYNFTHSGRNEVRYNYLKDIQRIEKLKTKEQFGKGYAILLTYDLSYKIDNTNKEYEYNSFSIHEGRIIEIGKELSWANTSNKLNNKQYKNPLLLQTKGPMKWQPYNKYDVVVNNKSKTLEFEYLITEISK